MPPPQADDRGGISDRQDAVLAERVDTLDALVHELDAQLRAAELASDGKTLKELRRALEAWAKHDPKLAERLTNRVDVLTDRLATLSQTANTTAASLAAKDGELAALRRELEAAQARLTAASDSSTSSVSAKEVAELRAAVNKLSVDRPSRKDEGRLDDLNAKVKILAERLETVSKTTATTASGLAGREGELAVLRRKVDDRLGTFEATVSELRAVVDPSPILELRQTIKTLSDETGTLKRDRQRLLDAVTSKFETVEGKLDLVTGAAATAAAGLATQEQEVEGLRASTREATATVASTVADLRQSLADLTAQVAELDGARSGDAIGALGERLDKMSAVVGPLVDRVDDLSSGQQEAASAASTVADLGQALADLSTQVSALGETASSADAMGTLEARIDKIGAVVTPLVDKVDDIAANAKDMASARAERDRDLTEVRERLEETRAHVDSVAAELRGSIEALPTTNPTEAANSARLEELTRRIEAFPGEITRIEDELATRRKDETTGLAKLVAEVTERMDAVDRDREAVASQLTLAATDWAADRDALRDELNALAAEVGHAGSADREAELQVLLTAFADRIEAIELDRQSATAQVAQDVARSADERARLQEQLESLTIALASASRGIDDVTPRLDEAASRIGAIEQTLEATRVDAERASTTREAELQALRDEVDALTATLAAASSEGEVESEHRLTSLADRLDAVERDGVTVASEIGRAAAFWASQIRELEGKIEALSSAAPASKPGDDASNALVADLMGRVQTLEVERTAESADTASRRELSELRNLVGQLELRLAERERELETTHDAAADLADVLTRVEMLEQVDGPPGSTSAGDGSDGRLRIELRALELRMDHAEAAARENREAVLVQLERLASRIEWRLGQLESEHAAGEEDQPDDSATLGQVVPIHGEA